MLYHCQLHPLSIPQSAVKIFEVAICPKIVIVLVYIIVLRICLIIVVYKTWLVSLAWTRLLSTLSMLVWPMPAMTPLDGGWPQLHIRCVQHCTMLTYVNNNNNTEIVWLVGEPSTLSYLQLPLGWIEFSCTVSTCKHACKQTFKRACKNTCKHACRHTCKHVCKHMFA